MYRTIVLEVFSEFTVAIKVCFSSYVGENSLKIIVKVLSVKYTNLRKFFTKLNVLNIKTEIKNVSRSGKTPLGFHGMSVLYHL